VTIITTAGATTAITGMKGIMAKDTTAITDRAAANTDAIEHFRESEINHADPA
jgi:hypothetical protein